MCYKLLEVAVAERSKHGTYWQRESLLLARKDPVNIPEEKNDNNIIYY
jgi:hypothetical protein